MNYSGNDLFDSYQMVYERGIFPQLKSDKTIQNEINNAEKESI